MRPFLISAAAAALVLACSPPAEREAEAPPQTPPTVQACNDVAPDAARQVQVEGELAVAAAASDLRGGSIVPGVYDLVSARRIGAATGWQGTRAAALDVSEAASGAVTFNWASAAPGEVRDTWTATFTEAPGDARLTYTCGRIGTIGAEFSAEANALELRLPDGANGRLALAFERRS